MAFDEDLLFTHRGLSGPAVLQISSYWREGPAVEPGAHGGPAEALQQAKARSRKLIANELATLVPAAWPMPGRSARPTGSAPSMRLQRQGPGQAGRATGPLGADTHRHRGLQRPR